MKTTLYIPDSDYAELKKESEASHRSVSWILVNSWREGRIGVKPSVYERPTSGSDIPRSATKKFARVYPTEDGMKSKGEVTAEMKAKIEGITGNSTFRPYSKTTQASEGRKGGK